MRSKTGNSGYTVFASWPGAGPFVPSGQAKKSPVMVKPGMNSTLLAGAERRLTPDDQSLNFSGDCRVTSLCEVPRKDSDLLLRIADPDN